MNKNKLLVKAIWDDEADVWVATSDDLPGLVVEAATTDDLEEELKLVIPELLKLNGFSLNIKQRNGDMS